MPEDRRAEVSQSPKAAGRPTLDVKQATVGKSDLAQNRELVGRYGRPLAVVELQDNEIRKDFVVTVSVKVQAVTAAVGVHGNR